MTLEDLTTEERFFLPFIDDIQRLIALKNWKSYRNLTQKFYFEYHIVNSIDWEPLFQILFDFNWWHVQEKIFKSSDYEYFKAWIDWIRDIFRALK